MISVAFQALIVNYKPLEDPLDLKFAMFNELMVSVYLYIMICLTDFIGENPLRDELGYVLLF
jgi:hypothetical protein